MTKDVLVSISGLHQDAISDLPDEENEPIEVVTPASYYCKNGKHARSDKESDQDLGKRQPGDHQTGNLKLTYGF